MTENKSPQQLKLIPNDVFWKFLRAARGDWKPTYLNYLALDPGETTGVAKWFGEESFEGGHKDYILLEQWDTSDVVEGYKRLRTELEDNYYQHIRCEDYKVYANKAEAHSWGSNHTSQFIGTIKVAAHQHGIPLDFCMAMHAKAFVTDEKLKMWGLYSSTGAMRHARDACRHLIYFLMFPKKDISTPQQ